MSSSFYLYADGTEHRIRENCIAFLQKLPLAKKWKITITAYKADRSALQNKALFGVAYPALMAHNGDSVNAWHFLACGEFFGWREIEAGNGKMISFPVRTTTTNELGEYDVIDKMRFCDFYSSVQRIGAERGCYVPDPDPYWRQQ